MFLILMQIGETKTDFAVLTIRNLWKILRDFIYPVFFNVRGQHFPIQQCKYNV